VCFRGIVSAITTIAIHIIKIRNLTRIQFTIWQIVLASANIEYSTLGVIRDTGDRALLKLSIIYTFGIEFTNQVTNFILGRTSGISRYVDVELTELLQVAQLTGPSSTIMEL
jgi:hypothetical protein